MVDAIIDNELQLEQQVRPNQLQVSFMAGEILTEQGIKVEALEELASGVNYSAVEIMDKVAKKGIVVSESPDGLMTQIPTSVSESGVLYGECRGIAGAIHHQLHDRFPELSAKIRNGLAPTHFVIEGSSNHYWNELADGVVFDAALGNVTTYRESGYEKGNQKVANPEAEIEFAKVLVSDYDANQGQPVAALSRRGKVTDPDVRRSAVIGKSANGDYAYALFYYQPRGNNNLLPAVKRIAIDGSFELFFKNQEMKLANDRGPVIEPDKFREVNQILDLSLKALRYT